MSETNKKVDRKAETIRRTGAARVVRTAEALRMRRGRDWRHPKDPPRALSRYEAGFRAGFRAGFDYAIARLEEARLGRNEVAG